MGSLNFMTLMLRRKPSCQWRKRNGNTNNSVSIFGRIRELEDELSTTLHMLQSGRGALAHDIKPNEVRKYICMTVQVSHRYMMVLF